MKRNKKTKTRALHIIIGFSILIPIALFGVYEIGLFDKLFSKPDNYGDAGIKPEVTEEPYIIQHINTSCGHNRIEANNILPKESFGENWLLEMGGADVEYNLPEGWHVATFEDKVILTHFKDLCDDCSNKFYLGNHEGEIAIFQGIPPNGIFFKGLEIEVKDVYKDILDEGITYSSSEEKRALLESFTS